MGYSPVLYGFCPVHLYAGQLPLSLLGWSLSWGIPPLKEVTLLKSARAPPPVLLPHFGVLGPFGVLPLLCLATAPRLSDKLVNFLTILPPGIPSHTPQGFE